MKRSLSSALSLLLAAASASAQVPAASAMKIGTAAAVRGAVKATGAGSAVGRVVSSGKPLFLNDHVTTDAAGHLQVLLVDETVFTLGPNSDMVLDDFVYDPKTSAGKVTANIAKGTFRFVTGKIAQKDPSQLKIKVAVGTIGVRGSIGVGETGPGGTTIINGGARNPDNHDDSAGIYAQSGGKTVNLTQPGVGTHIDPSGKIADASFLTGDLNRIMGSLQTEPGKSGGKGGDGSAFGRRSATDASGRSTSVGGVLAGEHQDSAELVSTLDSTLVDTFQTINSGLNGTSTWDEIINGIPSGTGSYSGSGTYSCSGGTGGCSSPTSGSFSFTTSVNFATHDITGATFAKVTGGATFNATLSGAVPFGTSGTATFSYNGLSPSGQGTFSGTNGTFADRAGTIAKDLSVNLNAIETGSGVVTGTGSGSR